MYNFWVHNISNLIPPTGYKLILFYYEKLFNDTAHDCFDDIMLFKGR